MAQAVGWFLAGVCMFPIAIALYGVVAIILYPRIPWFFTVATMLQMYFVPFLLISVSTIILCTIVLLILPRLSSWVFLVPLIALLMIASTWFAWVYSDLLSEPQYRDLARVMLPTLLASRFLLPVTRPGRVSQPKASNAT